MTYRIDGHTIVFSSGNASWKFPLILSEKYSEPIHKARYAVDTLSRLDGVHLAELAEALRYLTCTCPTSEMATLQLRWVRKALRSQR
jgi:hypothetical protein